MRRTRYALALALILVTLVGASCNKAQSDKALLVSGESLYGIGAQYQAVAGIYKQGCDVTKTISDAQCSKFRTFQEGFHKAYRPTVEAWDLAYRTNDKARRQSAATTIIGLSVELAVLAADVIDLTKGKVK